MLSKKKTIFTCFAGKKPNISVLKRYLDRLIEMKLIDEVHFWNYTKNGFDEAYLEDISNLKRLSGTCDKYKRIYPDVSAELEYKQVKLEFVTTTITNNATINLKIICVNTGNVYKITFDLKCNSSSTKLVIQVENDMMNVYII